MKKNDETIRVSSESKLQLPLANLIAIIIFISGAVFSYANLTGRITALETSDQLMSSDLLKKADQTPKNLEIFMLIESNAETLEKHQELLDKNIHTQVMLEHLENQLSKALKDIEDLKNKTRHLNGGH
jgi:hypothetical protein